MRGEIYIPVLIGLYKCNYYLIFRRVTVLLTPQTLVIMFVILSKESFKKKAVCYSIKQPIKLLLLQKEETLQCNGLKSKHSNSFLLFDVNFVLFCFCTTNFDVFTIFSELSGLKGNVYFMKIHIPMKSSILSLPKYVIFM